MMRTETEIHAELAMYTQALARVLESGQSFTLANGTTVTQANISWVEKRIGTLRSELYMVQQGGGHMCQTGVFGGRR